MRHKLITACMGLMAAFLSLQAQTGQEPTQYRIDLGRTHQTMDGFGASDAWTAQYIGLWPREKVEQAADWLFSTKNDRNGKPLGAGFSIWRFNVGAGSHDQGSESRIKSPWRRTECFMNADGSFDWDRQAGQRNFLRLAKERGVPTFIAFLNSPPRYFTINGITNNIGRENGSINLRPECYGRFALFMADVVEGMKRHDGIDFAYLSPLNEPEWGWNDQEKQEGTPANNREIARVVRLLGNELHRRGLRTQVLMPEAADYRFLYPNANYKSEWNANKVKAFFDASQAETYVGDVPNVPRLVAAHAYWTTAPDSFMLAVRKEVGKELGKYGIGFWQSEVCGMNNDTEIGGGAKMDMGINTALYYAKQIHHDIVYAGARSWQWWLAFCEGAWKDGLVRYSGTDPMKDGTLEASKFLWAIGNYSRFVRPGAVRVELSAQTATGKAIPEGDTDRQGLMATAYRNTDGSQVVVVVNYAHEAKAFRIEAARGVKKRWDTYLTSDSPGADLQPTGVVRTGETVTAPARSILTLRSK